MKEIIRRLEIKAYFDIEGKPICGDCIHKPKRHGMLNKFNGVDWIPGPDCPVWQGGEQYSDEPRICFKCGGKTKVIYCKTCQSILPQEDVNR